MPPLWQIVTSIGLCVLTIWGLAWLGAKIFRVGMLMYGKKPSLGRNAALAAVQVIPWKLSVEGSIRRA